MVASIYNAMHAYITAAAKYNPTSIFNPTRFLKAFEDMRKAQAIIYKLKSSILRLVLKKCVRAVLIVNSMLKLVKKPERKKSKQIPFKNTKNGRSVKTFRNKKYKKIDKQLTERGSGRNTKLESTKSEENTHRELVI
jgi:hypothetical protein